MKNTALFITACLALILLAAMVGCRHTMNMLCGPKASKDRVETMTKKLSQELDLTDEQNNHLNIIKGEMIVKLSEQKKHRAEMFTVIREEIQKDSIDQRRLEKLFDDRKQFREDMHRFMLYKFAEFHTLLTKEQRVKLSVLIEKMENQCVKE